MSAYTVEEAADDLCRCVYWFGNYTSHPKLHHLATQSVFVTAAHMLARWPSGGDAVQPYVEQAQQLAAILRGVMDRNGVTA